jgi:hypothetical protein
MMEITSPINSEKRALWRQDNIKNNSLQSHRCLGMLTVNKRRERRDRQDQEDGANRRHAVSVSCDVADDVS